MVNAGTSDWSGGGAGSVTSVGLAAGTAGTDITVSGSPITTAGVITINIPTASATNRGALSAADWILFNSKQNALTIGNLTANGAAGFAVTGGVASIIGAGISIVQQAADATHNGYLTTVDWNIFNSKGAGTVTAVSVVTANGLAGSSSGGATPVLTLSCTITGVLKSNGATISAAAAGDLGVITDGISITGTGTTGNPLIASGAVTPGIAGGFTIFSFALSLTAAQIKTANSAPIDIGLPLSGAGFYYRVAAFDINYVFGTVPFTSTQIGISFDNNAVNSQWLWGNLAIASSVFSLGQSNGGSTPSYSDNTKLLLIANADSLVGDGTIDCYVTIQKIKL